MSLEGDLLDASPGDVVTFRGEQRLGKVIGVRGTASAPITLRGEDASAVLVVSPDYLYSVARFEQSEHLILERFKIDGAWQAERALQVFRSNHVTIRDLETSAVTQDHLHLPGCNHVLIQRVMCNGRGGENMGGGRGGHSVYFTKVDGGGGCTDLVAEDIDCDTIAGAGLQANGDGAWLEGVVFRRCRAVNYGRLGGSGVNLAYCRDPLLEDIILRPHTLNDNPGIASFDGTTGTILRRHDIECEDLSSGPMSAVAGVPAEPQPPDFSGETEPPPEPEPGPEPEPEAGMQWCPDCGGDKTQMGPDGAVIPCARCAGEGVVPLPS